MAIAEVAKVNNPLIATMLAASTSLGFSHSFDPAITPYIFYFLSVPTFVGLQSRGGRLAESMALTSGQATGFAYLIEKLTISQGAC